MTFRFQRRIRLAPGLHLNLSKRGVGFSAGPRGFHIGVDSRRRPYLSTGIPGTGLSWREYPGRKQPAGVSSGCSGLLAILIIAGFTLAVVWCDQ